MLAAKPLQKRAGSIHAALRGTGRPCMRAFRGARRPGFKMEGCCTAGSCPRLPHPASGASLPGDGRRGCARVRVGGRARMPTPRRRRQGRGDGEGIASGFPLRQAAGCSNVQEWPHRRRLCADCSDGTKAGTTTPEIAGSTPQRDWVKRTGDEREEEKRRNRW